jgi:hypothetical protein
MSSGIISKDRQIAQFEINHNNIQGHFTLALLPSPEWDVDGEQRVSMKLTTSCMRLPDNMVCTNSVIITKPYTRVLANIFREMADLMDEWYEVNRD